MMLTEFGKFCRKLRIDEGELLKDMAEKLGITSSYLSAVEVGKRTIPEGWVSKISEIYNLTELQREELENAADLSRDSINISLSELEECERDIMLSFARRIKKLESAEKDDIKAILDNHKSK